MATSIPYAGQLSTLALDAGLEIARKRRGAMVGTTHVKDISRFLKDKIDLPNNSEPQLFNRILGRYFGLNPSSILEEDRKTGLELISGELNRHKKLDDKGLKDLYDLCLIISDVSSNYIKRTIRPHNPLRRYLAA